MVQKTGAGQAAYHVETVPPRIFSTSLKRKHPEIWMILAGVLFVLDEVGRVQTLVRILGWFNSMVWPHHILSVIGVIFTVVGIVQFLTSCHSVLSPLCVDHLVIESCSVSSSLAIEPGSTHRVAIVEILNDPRASNPTKAGNLTAKLIYYDSPKIAYRNVEYGLWKPDSSLQQEIWIGGTASLVIAVQDATGRGFTIGFTPQSFDKIHESLLRRFEANLNNGTNTVKVILSYNNEQGKRENQHFTFALTIGKDLRIEDITNS